MFILFGFIVRERQKHSDKFARDVAYAPPRYDFAFPCGKSLFFYGRFEQVVSYNVHESDLTRRDKSHFGKQRSDILEQVAVVFDGGDEYNVKTEQTRDYYRICEKALQIILLPDARD